MIPKQELVLGGSGFEEQPSLTYKLNREENRISASCDDIEAVSQAIYKILNTERYDCAIYSWNYGVELKDLIGMPINYCMLEIERRITEALVQDDRIKRVYGFEFEQPQRGMIRVGFSVETTKGIWNAEKEVYV